MALFSIFCPELLHLFPHVTQIHVTQIHITWFPLARKNPLLTETNNATFGSGGNLH